MSMTPTLYEWCGGHDALLRLTEVFYGRVLADPVLEPVFRHMGPHHREHVALWLGEVFGGPTTYTDEQGGYPSMLKHHIGLGITEEQRARWAAFIAASATRPGCRTTRSSARRLSRTSSGYPHRQGQRGRRGDSPAGPAVASMGMGRGTALRGLTPAGVRRR